MGQADTISAIKEMVKTKDFRCELALLSRMKEIWQGLKLGVAKHEQLISSSRGIIIHLKTDVISYCTLKGDIEEEIRATVDVSRAHR